MALNKWESPQQGTACFEGLTNDVMNVYMKYIKALLFCSE